MRKCGQKSHFTNFKPGLPVTQEKHTPDIWDSLSFIVWCLLFLIGLFPEIVFLQVRAYAHLISKEAFTNTPLFITFAATGFLSWFTYSRCRLLGDSDDYAILKSTHVALMTFFAFFPVHVEHLPLYLAIPVPFFRYLLTGAVAFKAFLWVVLLLFLLQYHMFRGLAAFRKIPLIFWLKILASYRDEEKAAAVAAGSSAALEGETEKSPGENPTGEN